MARVIFETTKAFYLGKDVFITTMLITFSYDFV